MIMQEMIMVKDALSEAENRMKGAITALEEDLATIRTGRASPALVERLNIDYYDTPTPLMQLATISAPEPRMLTIRPFDPASIKDITGQKRRVYLCAMFVGTHKTIYGISNERS
jgi:ribosome recycling factor